MNNKTIYQVDSFTNKMFKGNPAGVMILDTALEPDLMQKIANEMNLSETAFVCQSGDHFEIRYFTPIVEVPLCGHATLASAHILYTQEFINKESEKSFKAKQVNRKVDEYYVAPKNGWNLAYISNSDLSELKPDFQLIGKLASELVVTSNNADSEYDFFVRCFVPNAGINEDPVTGAVNCILSTFWKEKLKKDHFVSKQMSARTGIIKTQVFGNRVKISGQAKTVFRAELMV